VGKGGSGKTTAAAAFGRRLAASGRRVVPPPSEAERGQLPGPWPATRSAARWNATTAWCSPSRTATAVTAFDPAAVDGASYRAFISPRAQLLHQSPELRDC